MPDLSVIVPFFNVAAYARDTLRSLAANAAPGIEFLLVDDGSTDGTGAILDEWTAGRGDARLLRHDRNRGIAAARNTGIDAACGDHLTFLDGDDWYAPGHLTALLAAAHRYGCDVVKTGHVKVFGTERLVAPAPGAPRNRVLDPRAVITPADAETMVDYPFVWAGIYRRTLFAGGGMRFAEHLRTAEDRLWTWSLHLTAESLAVVGLPGVFYRRGVTTSLTQIRDERQLDFLPAHDALLAMVAADRDAGLLLPKAVRTYCAMIAFHVASSDRYEPAAARRLRGMAADALGRMPAGVLDRTLEAMQPRRARLLRRLRRRSRR